MRAQSRVTAQRLRVIEMGAGFSSGLAKGRQVAGQRLFTTRVVTAASGLAFGVLRTFTGGAPGGSNETKWPLLPPPPFRRSRQDPAAAEKWRRAD